MEQAAGSARVSIEGGRTDVVAAVKVELTQPQKEDEGVLEVDVDTFVPISAASQRRAMLDVSQELSLQLHSLLLGRGALDLKLLCIIKGQLAWKVYLDIVILEAGGSLLDACSLAACAALCSTELPRLRLIHGEGGRIDVDLDQDGDEEATTRFPAEGVPLAVTCAALKQATVVDTSLEEESVADNRVVVSMNRAGAVCSVEAEAGSIGGEAGMQVQVLQAALEATKAICGKLYESVDVAVAAYSAKALKCGPLPVMRPGSLGLSDVTPHPLGRAKGAGGFLVRA